MEPEQCPGSSSDPPKLQTTADGQPFTEGSEAAIDSFIMRPLLDLSAKNRETQKLSPTLDSFEIKGKTPEVTHDVDEHQRIYISDLHLELVAGPEAPFEIDLSAIISASSSTDQPIQLKRISPTAWKQADVSKSFARGNSTLTIQSQDGKYEANCFLGKGHLRELSNQEEAAKRIEEVVISDDSMLTARISFQIVPDETTEKVYQAEGIAKFRARDIVGPDAPISLINIEEMIARALQDCHGSPQALVEALLKLPDNLPGKSTILGRCGDMILPWPCDDRLSKLDAAIRAFETRRKLRLSDGSQANDEVELDIAEAQAREQRFEVTRKRSDLDRAIEILDDVTSAPLDEKELLLKVLDTLGLLHWQRFSIYGDLTDINEAVAPLRRKVELSPADHPNLPLCLSNLGAFLGTRFKRTGVIHDLDEAISSARRAVDLTPADPPTDLVVRLDNLQHLLNIWFGRTDNIHDLEEDISRYRRAVKLMPVDHPGLLSPLRNLGHWVSIRFQRTGDNHDLEEAARNYRRAAELTPVDDPNRAMQFTNLGAVLGYRSIQTGDIRDLEESISAHRRAIECTQADHLDLLPARLNNLGLSLAYRFRWTGDIDNLQESALSCRQSVELTSEKHPDLATFLDNLGVVLGLQFDRIGDIDNLAEAVSIHRRAIEFTPPNHADLPKRLTNLGIRLGTRFEWIGDAHDVEEAISSIRRAIELTPPAHPELSTRVSALGNRLGTRFDRESNPGDLDEAISNNRLSIELTPMDHPELPLRLNNLGKWLLVRFRRTHLTADVENAISSNRRAVELTPVNHHDLPTWLTNLGNGFGEKFKQTGYIGDLEEAISSHRRAIELTPADHPGLSAKLNNLAVEYHQQGPQGLPLALKAFRDAASQISAAPSVRLHAARQWARVCRSISHPDFETSFRLSMDLLQELVGLEHPIELRHGNLNLSSTSNLAAEAAATAIFYSRSDLALEWLEQGRCLIWSQLSQLRSPLEDLRDVDEELAQKFQQLSSQLEMAAHRQRGQLEDSITVKISLQREADQYRLIAKERGELLEKIRKIPGFEYFLRPHPASYFLDNLPDDGPVILINADEERCDAIALVKGLEVPLHVPLPELTLKRVIGLRKKLQTCVGLNFPHTRSRDIKLAGTVDLKDIHFVLERLWVCLVKPVLDALGFNPSPSALNRIWWCPTGPFAFLPIHAAGLYNADDSQSLLDYAVSSYIPTVTSLVEKRKSLICSKGLFLVSQAKAPGLFEIPGADKETDALSNMMQKQGISHLHFSGTTATVQKVKDNIGSYSAIHLACHGSQIAEKPLESGFYLQDQDGPNEEPRLGCLRLSEIIKQDLRNADFAFLSACQTSTGDQNLSDEAVHLAAGMFAAGYRSVIGTMWSIQDQYGQFLAEEFYQNLLERSTADGVARLDGSQAAYALHHAVNSLRNKVGNGNHGFSTWLPYVHFGV